MNMHDPVGIAKKASKLAWLAAAMALGLFACQVEDSIERDNPSDAVGTNYHLPTVSVVTPADTTFRDSSSLRIQVRDSSANSRIVRLRWTLDGSVSDSTTDTTWHPRSGLSEGQHLIVVRAVDSTGLVSLPDTVCVKVYNKPPVLAHVRDTTLLINQAVVVTLSAHDSDGTVKKYLFDTTGNGWDSSATALTLRFTSASEVSRKIRWGARDDLGKTTTDSFAVTFMMDRPLLTAISDTIMSASKTLVVPLNARPLDGSSSAVTKYLWSTNGSTWDSSSTASISLSDTAGGALTVQWKARNSLGNVSKPDTFVVTFLHAPTITSLSVDSNLTSWSSGTGSLIFTWAGSLPNVPAGETITWTLSGGTSGLSQLYSGTFTTYTQSGIDSGVTYNYRLVGRNRFGDSVIFDGHLLTSYGHLNTIGLFKRCAGSVVDTVRTDSGISFEWKFESNSLDGSYGTIAELQVPVCQKWCSRDLSQADSLNLTIYNSSSTGFSVVVNDDSTVYGKSTHASLAQMVFSVTAGKQNWKDITIPFDGFSMPSWCNENLCGTDMDSVSWLSVTGEKSLAPHVVSFGLRPNLSWSSATIISNPNGTMVLKKMSIKMKDGTVIPLFGNN